MFESFGGIWYFQVRFFVPSSEQQYLRQIFRLYKVFFTVLLGQVKSIQVNFYLTYTE